MATFKVEVIRVGTRDETTVGLPFAAVVVIGIRVDELMVVITGVVS